MNVTLSSRPDPAVDLDRLHAVLARTPARLIACSGGVDSLLLATVAHRAAPSSTVVAHTVTPAVPGEATARVRQFAAVEGWDLRVVTSGEFDDEQYLSNPHDRCYHCKSHLYDAIAAVRTQLDPGTTSAILSGANLDDLGEYRPGLDAAAERAVRHPFVDAGITKSAIRAIARSLDLPVAELAASPCLASRLYTGTRVTPARLAAVEAGEALLRRRIGVEVVRCRVREQEVLIEVGDGDRHLVTREHEQSVLDAMAAIEPGLRSARLDHDAYRPGRAVVR